MKLFLGIDVGTTAVKCLVMNHRGEVCAVAAAGHPLSSPKPSWVEQWPPDWWKAVIRAVRACLQQVDVRRIVSVSLSGHMSALVLLDKAGQPLCPSILIADSRSAKQTEYLRAHWLERFTAATGNEPLDAFTVSKLLWVKEEAPELYRRAAAFLFPKDYIRYRLTGRLGSEPTDAGNSLLYDRKTGDWNWPLIQELGLRSDLFPALAHATEIFGFVTEEASAQTGLVAGTPVICGAADMACSQIGTGAVKAGTMAITLSTSGQVVTSVPDIDERGIGRVTFHPAAARGSVYAMGTIFTGGLGVDWAYRFLFNKRKMEAEDFAELEKLTDRMEGMEPGSGGLLFLPFLVGSGTPYFDARDRASWLGLTLNQDKPLLLHSVLEGIAYHIRESMDVFQEMNVEIHRVTVGGGGSKNKRWCQIIANVLGKKLDVLANRDASALGAAVLAAVGTSEFPSLDAAVDEVIKIKERIDVDGEKHERYQRLYENYRSVYRALNRYYRAVEY
ncbi:xylulokinase [Bacillaceae bacterium]